MGKTNYLQPAAKAGMTLLIALAMICAVFMITGEPAFAETTEDGWVYEDAGDGTLRITGYEGEEEDVVVPAMIGEKAVSEIGDGAIAGTPYLHTITVSEGITTIGEEAFADCPSLLKVTLPDTVTSIGRRAFRYCYALNTCILPKTLQEFPYQCFWECRVLTEITIPEGVTTIPNGAFYNNEALTQVIIPDSVTTIGKNAFHACLKLTMLQLSEYIEEIDPSAFSDCEKLEIFAPEGSYADTFAKENGYGPEPAILESEHPYPLEDQQWTYTHPTEAAALVVTFSTKTRFSTIWDEFCITDEAGNTYEYFGPLLAGKTLVLVGDSFTMDLWVMEEEEQYFGFRITAIEPMTAEEYQAYLDDIEAHPWLTRIVNGTLELTGYRASHQEVVIPARIDGVPVASIAQKVFMDNKKLRKVTIEEGVCSIKGNAFRTCENLEEITIADSVTEIKSLAFGDCAKLKKVKLPKNLTVLEFSAFQNCTALEEIALPEGLATIPNWLFSGCKNLKKVTIPDSVTRIGSEIFERADKAVIYASANSTAFHYAEENGLKAIDVPQAKAGQYADGQPKELVTAGKATGGKLVYALGESADTAPEATAYSEAIPTGVDGGTYHVWFKMTEVPADDVKDDADVQDLTDPECISVKILSDADRGITEDGWRYEDIGDGSLRITGYEGQETDVVVPTKIEEKNVIEIGKEALARKEALYTIRVPEGITTIGEEAFADCPYLQEVVLPDTVTSMGRRTFRYCFNLQECTLPKTLQEFPYQCFWDCQSLSEITIPDGVTIIPNGAFYNNSSLQKVTVPDSVTTIEKNAFHACLWLGEIRLSEHIQEIDPSAFSDCEMLEIIAPAGSPADTFARENGFGPEPVVGDLETRHPCPVGKWHWDYTYPADAAALQVTFSPRTHVESGWGKITVTDEDGYVFTYSGKKLAGQTLILPGNSFAMDVNVQRERGYFGLRVTSIEAMTGEEYDAYLKEIEAQPWLTHIVNGTLEISGYRGRAEVAVIPEKINGIPVVSIAERAFLNNPILRKVTIETGLRSIEVNAFRRCSNLEEVILPDSVTEIGDYAFGDCTKLKSIRLPEGHVTLGDSIFSGCTALEELSLPEGITVLSDCLCAGCKNLKKVSLPDSLKEIGRMGLYKCRALEELTLPEGLEVIGKEAFYETGLRSITIPASVHTIDSDPFALCRNMTQLTVDSGNPYFSARDGILYNKSGDRLICCAGGLTGVITVPDGVQEIKEAAFCDATEITGMILPGSLTKLGDDVFCGCKSLEEIVLPEGITTMPRYAFSGCDSLTELRLPASLTEIQYGAFVWCDNLKRVHIPDSVTSIDTAIFIGSDRVVIYASADSTAFHYAEENGLKAIDVPQAKAGQYADGQPKELVTAGKATGGKLVYALGESADKAPEASAYSEAIPTGTKSGTYYVWFKMTGVVSDDAAGDEEAQDLTDSECIQVKLLGDVDRVEEKINALPAKITKKDKAAVDAAIAAWLKLTKSEKASVSASAVKKLAAADDAIYCSIAKDRKIKIKSAKRKKGRKARIKWTKSPGASGYMIRYSTSKKFKKGVKTRKTSDTKIILKKLKKGKKYYVQVTPYTNVKNRVTGVTRIVYGHKSKKKKL